MSSPNAFISQSLQQSVQQPSAINQDEEIMKALATVNKARTTPCILVVSPSSSSEGENHVVSEVPDQTPDKIPEERMIIEESMGDTTSVTEEKCCDYEGPYVPISIEEVSIVTTLKHWTNTNVRVIGKFSLTDFNTHILHGVGEDHGDLLLDLKNLDQYPKHGDIVEVFGKLHFNQNLCPPDSEQIMSQIIIKVMFFRPILDPFTYNKALSLVKPFIPLFVRRD